MSSVDQQKKVVGVQPWLPWPLSASLWWTKPVRAEYLAIVRIGLGIVLLLDLLFLYWPCFSDLYGAGSLGSPEMFRDNTSSPRWFWSLFRGLDHTLISTAALLVWLAATLYLIAGLFHQRRRETTESRNHRPLLIWVVSGIVYIGGVWTRELQQTQPSLLTWAVPLVFFLAAGFFVQIPRKQSGWLLFAWGTGLGLLILGMVLWFPRFGFVRNGARDLLLGWDGNINLLYLAFLVWGLFTLFLTIGFNTRVSTIIVWLLSISFYHLNPLINSGGDLVKNIILFYLMLSPCGAAWSVDQCFRRFSFGEKGPFYISPWPLRLMFLQLVCIYFFTGLHKITGETWLYGESLYYVLADLALTRLSYDQLAIPPLALQILTWVILGWQLSFPILVSIPYVRPIALSFGVLFHLGTLTLLELGGFEGYMLVLYLPLLPWSRWLGEKKGEGPEEEAKTQPDDETPTSPEKELLEEKTFSSTDEEPAETMEEIPRESESST